MQEEIIKIVANCLDVDATSISTNSDIKNTRNWDSLNHVKIILTLCERFNMKYEQSMVVNLTSIRKIINYLEEKVNDDRKNF